MEMRETQALWPDEIFYHVLYKLKEDDKQLCLMRLVCQSWRAKIDYFYGLYIYKENPLFLSAEKGNVGVLSSLLKTNTLVNRMDECGQTAMHKAASKGNIKCVEILITYGSGLNAQDVNRNTPMHLAAQACEDLTIETLLAHGALSNLKNNQKLLPLDILLKDKKRVNRKNFHRVFQNYPLLKKIVESRFKETLIIPLKLKAVPLDCPSFLPTQFQDRLEYPPDLGMRPSEIVENRILEKLQSKFQNDIEKFTHEIQHILLETVLHDPSEKTELTQFLEILGKETSFSLAQDFLGCLDFTQFDHESSSKFYELKKIMDEHKPTQKLLVTIQLLTALHVFLHSFSEVTKEHIRETCKNFLTIVGQVRLNNIKVSTYLNTCLLLIHQLKRKMENGGLVPLGKMCSPLYQETPCPSKTIQKTVISKEHLKLDPVPLFTDVENFQPYKRMLVRIPMSVVLNFPPINYGKPIEKFTRRILQLIEETRIRPEIFERYPFFEKFREFLSLIKMHSFQKNLVELETKVEGFLSTQKFLDAIQFITILIASLKSFPNAKSDKLKQISRSFLNEIELLNKKNKKVDYHRTCLILTRQLTQKLDKMWKTHDH